MKRTAWPVAAVLVFALAGPLGAQTATDSTGTNPNATSSTGTTGSTTHTTHKHRAKHHRRMRKHNANAADSTGTSGTLPKTASPLPGLAAGGLATLAAGVWLTRRRRAV